MIIRRAKTEDISKIYDFNRTIFPDKKINSRKYIDFWISKSPKAIEEFLLLDDNGTIVGQDILSAISYYYKGEKIETVWGFDLIIEEKYRKDSWGLDLMLKSKELFPRLLATGSGPNAKAINLKMGMKDLGDIRKYVGIINPFFFLTSFKKKAVAIDKYPGTIKVNGTAYHKVNAAQLSEYSTPFSDDLLEITREKEYLKWRFYNDLHQYAFYLRDNGTAFFVLRSIEIKGFRVMALVDFRCKNSENDFEEIYQATAKVTKKLHLPVLVCGSSLKNLDAVLERHHFKSIGRPRPILGYLKCKDRKLDIEDRNFCFVTLADSDGETNWI